MTNSKIGLTKEEIKKINFSGWEFGVWWLAKKMLTIESSLSLFKIYSGNGFVYSYKYKHYIEYINKGLWQPSTELLEDLVISLEIDAKYLEWEETDISNGWLPIYYDMQQQLQIAENPESCEAKTTLDKVYKSLIPQTQFDNAVFTNDENFGHYPEDMAPYRNRWLTPQEHPQLDIKLIKQINEAITAEAGEYFTPFRIDEWFYVLLAREIVWDDEIEGFPISWDSIDIPDYVGSIHQVCDVHPLQYLKADFIKGLFDLYCPNWTFNQRQSKKKVLVYDRPYLNDDYQWYITVSKHEPNFGFRYFHVFLAKKLPVKLSPLNVIFEAFFPLKILHQFNGERYISKWKIQVKHRYMYVERYIDYIEPMIAKRMQGVE